MTTRSTKDGWTTWKEFRSEWQHTHFKPMHVYIHHMIETLMLTDTKEIPNDFKITWKAWKDRGLEEKSNIIDIKRITKFDNFYQYWKTIVNDLMQIEEYFKLELDIRDEESDPKIVSFKWCAIKQIDTQQTPIKRWTITKAKNKVESEEEELDFTQ